MSKSAVTSLVHWNYYLALEKDLDRISRYIEFHEENYGTYSIELAHLLLASASEVDVIAKEICLLVKPGSKFKNIDDYREIIMEKLPELCEEVVYIPKYQLEFIPWKRWKSSENPDWWGSYNNVKHHRREFFFQANLKNILNSISGLLIFELYYYKTFFDLVKKSDTLNNLNRVEMEGLLQFPNSYYYHNYVAGGVE